VKAASLAIVVVLLTAGLARGAGPASPPAPASRAPAAPPDAVTVADVLRVLRDESPRLAAERPQIDAARGDLVTARALPNPTLAYDGGSLVDGANVNGAWQHQATLSAPLPITGVRAARVAVAEKGIEVAEGQVRSAYGPIPPGRSGLR